MSIIMAFRQLVNTCSITLLVFGSDFILERAVKRVLKLRGLVVALFLCLAAFCAVITPLF